MAIFGNKRFAPKHHLNYLRGSYLESTSRPLYALLFLLPWVAIYELGMMVVNKGHLATAHGRVTTFSWMMDIAELAGINHKWAWVFPGAVIIIILLSWHLVSRSGWSVRWRWLGGMAIESFVLTLPLFVVGALMNTSNTFSASNGSAGLSPTYAELLVTSVGAGIYEEFVFRLILMGLLIILFEDVAKFKPTETVILSVLISAGLFSAHHYLGAEPFTLGSFIYRTLAGLYLAAVFWYRGYGISAGTHAAYNMIYFTYKMIWG